MKTFFAVKKPIPVKFYDPLLMSDKELNDIGVYFELEENGTTWNIQHRPLFIGTLESKKYEFTAGTHLIVEGAEKEMYVIKRDIFEKTYTVQDPYENENEWFTLNSAGIHYSDGDERITNFIEEEISKNGLKSLECLFQDGAIKEVGINGLQWQQLLIISLSILKKLNANFPCRENAITITKLEEALMWQEKRTKDRKKRNVEGKSQD